MRCSQGTDLGANETFHADVVIYHHLVINDIDGCHRTVVYTTTTRRAFFLIYLNQ
jgi:hypothetical protein